MALKISNQFFMKWMLFALFIFSSPANAANSVEFLGSFSKVGITEEHQYIYQLDLWREGQKVFGFYSFNAGLYGDGITRSIPWRIAGDIKGKSLMLKNEHDYFSFTGQFSKHNLSGLWKDSMTKGIDVVLTKLPINETDPALLKASLVSPETWGQWAEQYLDSEVAKDKQLSKEVANCARGSGKSCLSFGNYSKLRGNLVRARNYYEAGCHLNEAYACLFLGDTGKAKEIWQGLCTGKATMENNFACLALGKLAEDLGNRSEAKEWYRKGCNDSIPLICPDFKRLDMEE